MNPMNLMDPYVRARTVRIGKWRWPPPKDETQGEQPVEGFFEFKMRKMSEKKDTPGGPSDPNERYHESFDTNDEIQGINLNTVLLTRAGKKVDFLKNRLIDSPEEKNRFKIDFFDFVIIPSLVNETATKFLL